MSDAPVDQATGAYLFSLRISMRVMLLDFDGTINSYRHGWTSDGDIPDEPIDGAQDAIMRLRRRYSVVVFSARARSVEGKNAIIAWLAKYNIDVDGVTATKIPAAMQVDDTALTFTGKWDSTMMKAIEEFQTWQDLDAESREQMKPIEELKDDSLSDLFSRPPHILLED